jgi:hypothetical protein
MCRKEGNRRWGSQSTTNKVLPGPADDERGNPGQRQLSQNATATAQQAATSNAPPRRSELWARAHEVDAPSRTKYCTIQPAEDSAPALELGGKSSLRRGSTVVTKGGAAWWRSPPASRRRRKATRWCAVSEQGQVRIHLHQATIPGIDGTRTQLTYHHEISKLQLTEEFAYFANPTLSDHARNGRCHNMRVMRWHGASFAFPVAAQ